MHRRNFIRGFVGAVVMSGIELGLVAAPVKKVYAYTTHYDYPNDEDAIVAIMPEILKGLQEAAARDFDIAMIDAMARGEFVENAGATEKGEWITNHPAPLRSWHPRRDCKFKEGRPKATNAYTTEQLEGQGLIGIYLDEDIPEGFRTRDFIK